MKLPNNPIKIAQFGLGPIGRSCARLVASRPDLTLIAGIDLDPSLYDCDAGTVSGCPEPLGARIYPTFEEMWAEVQPDVILHTAGSRATDSFRQCRPMLEKGLAVVSSCEQLLYPWHRAPEESDEIDDLCRRTGARILGTGVNPGFVLDLLPVCLTGVCREVHGVYGERVVNASLRRQPLQKKIGSGLEPEDFRALWREGKAGHAGFQESLLLVAHAMGWETGPVTETLEPVVTDRPIKTDHFEVLAGQTCGLHQRVTASTPSGQSIELDLKMYLDAPDPHDRLEVRGDPPVIAHLDGGVSGDIATVAAVVNSVGRLLASPPGLRLVTELPASAGRRNIFAMA